MDGFDDPLIKHAERRNGMTRNTRLHRNSFPELEKLGTRRGKIKHLYRPAFGDATGADVAKPACGDRARTYNGPGTDAPRPCRMRDKVVKTKFHFIGRNCTEYI